MNTNEAQQILFRWYQKRVVRKALGDINVSYSGSMTDLIKHADRIFIITNNANLYQEIIRTAFQMMTHVKSNVRALALDKSSEETGV